MNLPAASRCKVKLLLTEEESRRLAEAVRVSGAPNRSFLILQSIQSRLHARTLTGLQGRRNRILHCWLPIEIMREVRRLARERAVSQQSLIRYFLFTHPTQPETHSPTEAEAIDA